MRVNREIFILEWCRYGKLYRELNQTEYDFIDDHLFIRSVPELSVDGDVILINHRDFTLLETPGGEVLLFLKNNNEYKVFKDWMMLLKLAK
jgi:hypothetical protein